MKVLHVDYIYMELSVKQIAVCGLSRNRSRGEAVKVWRYRKLRGKKII